MPNRKFKRGTRRGRKSKNRPAKPFYLIVCEGEKTEPSYLDDLRRKKRIGKSRIRIVGSNKCNGTDPLTIIQCAIDLREKIKSTEELYYENTWCIIDIDDHSNLNKALKLAKREKIQVAISNPCIELWFLLHFTYSTAQLTSKSCINKFKRGEHLPGYNKDMTGRYNELKPKESTAFHNANKLREFHAGNGDPENSNPSTSIDELMRLLVNLTR